MPQETESSNDGLPTHLPPGPWRRGIARVLDQALLTALAVAIGSLTGFGDRWVSATALGVFAYFVVSVLLGGSIGKRVLGLAIHPDDDNAPPTLWSAASREAFVLLASLPGIGTLLGVVAWVTIAAGIRSDPEGRAWHDRLGRTVVTNKI